MNKKVVSDITVCSPWVDEQMRIGMTLDNINEPFFMVDNKWTFTYINPAAEKMAQISKQDLLGKNLWSSYNDLIESSFYEPYHRAMTERKAISFEEFYPAWGKWLEVKVFPYRDGLAIHLRDCTSHHESFKQLKLLESCIAHLRDIVILTDAGKVEGSSQYHPNILFVNNIFEDKTGYSKDDVIGKIPSFLQDLYGEHITQQQLQDAVYNQTSLKKDIVYRKKDQQTFWAELDIIPIFNDNAQLTNWVCVLRDIMERRKTEELLRNNEENMAFVLHSGDLAYWEYDQVNITRSELHDKLFGYQEKVELWNYDIFLNHVHPEDRYKLAHDYLCTSHDITGSGINVEFRVVWPNGEIHWLWIRGRYTLDANNKPVRASGIVTDITARTVAEEKIKQMALYDSLTGLPNRKTLCEKLEQFITCSFNDKIHGSLLFIDLDNFKMLNDTSGHDKGDIFLKEAALRIKSCLANVDSLGRLGGDEFLVILNEPCYSKEEAQNKANEVAQRILKSFSQPFKLGTYTYHSSVSIGITTFNDDKISVEQLLKQADLAMSKSKKSGKNTCTVFKEEMQKAINERAEMEYDMRKALMNNEFVLFYQPQVDINRKVIGAEVLLRWIHPEKGLIPPLRFIPLAEENGLILPISVWVLEESCRQLAKWAKNPDTADLTLAVNISIRKFQEPDFVASVLKALQETGANPHKLKLELTESLLINDMEDTIAKMTALKSYGVCFSLDDFGTGYSSLAYLKRMPLEQLKIDQSFVRDMLKSNNDAVISKTIINLAKSLDLQVIAEGVETQEQKHFLFENGCSFYQGYYFSKPVPIKEFQDFMDNEPQL